MKKINNQGFMMIEVLIVSTFVISVFIFFFIQFKTISDNYQVSFKYNTVNGLYAANNVKKYLMSIDRTDIETTLDESFYVDISNCPSQYITHVTYCQTLFEKLDIKKLYVTKQDLNSLISSIRSSSYSIFNENMKDFIEYIRFDNQVIGYRIIVEFNDQTFASIKL